MGIQEPLEKLARKYPDLAKVSAIEVIKRRITLLEREKKSLEEEINALETRYGDLEEYERKMGDSLEEHEVWIRWKALKEELRSLEEELVDLKELLEEIVG